MSVQIYTITNKAGRYVAGFRLDPDQTTIELTPGQASYELAQGTILPTGEAGSAPPDPPPVMATDRVELRRAGLATRPTAAELAGFVQQAPQRINAYAANVTLFSDDKGALVIITHASARTVTLPADWAAGESVTVRRGGVGAVSWAMADNATLVVPSAKAEHVGITAQHEEVIFKVLSNIGDAAVWSVSGSTA